MVSKIFEEVFDSRGGSIERICVCGRVHYNYKDRGCFESGEFEALERLTDSNPDKYFRHDHSIGIMEIPFAGEVVFDCPCGIAEKAEGLMRENSEKLAEYLNRYAECLREKAKAVEVRKGG